MIAGRLLGERTGADHFFGGDMSDEQGIRLDGTVQAKHAGNRLIVEGFDGNASAVIADKSGFVLLLYHPVSGWYVKSDARRERGDNLSEAE